MAAPEPTCHRCHQPRDADIHIISALFGYHNFVVAGTVSAGPQLGIAETTAARVRELEAALARERDQRAAVSKNLLDVTTRLGMYSRALEIVAKVPNPENSAVLDGLKKRVGRVLETPSPRRPAAGGPSDRPVGQDQ